MDNYQPGSYTMSKNTSLGNARNNKEDEFYTQLSDIEKELSHYKNHFNNLFMAKCTTITRKNDENDERTASASEFINRMIESRRMPDRNIELPKTEQPK